MLSSSKETNLTEIWTNACFIIPLGSGPCISSDRIPNIRPTVKLHVYPYLNCQSPLHRIIPNGIHGIQERMEAMWEDLVNFGYVTAMDYVRLTSTECARIFNIYPQKGVIAAGSDADIIVFDPTADHVMSANTHFSALDTSVFEGKKIKGKVRELLPSLAGRLMLLSQVGAIRCSTILGQADLSKQDFRFFLLEGCCPSD